MTPALYGALSLAALFVAFVRMAPLPQVKILFSPDDPPPYPFSVRAACGATIFGLMMWQMGESSGAIFWGRTGMALGLAAFGAWLGPQLVHLILYTVRVSVLNTIAWFR